MFSGASNFSAGVDQTFAFILAVAFFFLIGITATMIYFAIRYNRKRHPKATQVKDNMILEVVWTVIPVILVMFMFYYGYTAFIPERNIPKDAMPIKVTGRMWNWTFDYGNGKIRKDTLVVPLNKAVQLNMNSLDVTHSLYIPAFRIKEDLVPGQQTNMWFIAQEKGTYDILCAEFCGLRHSYMEGRVVVLDEPEFNKWLASVKAEDPNAIPAGLILMRQNGCTGCHTFDGSKLAGPSLKGLYGSQRVVIRGGNERTIKADSTYIRNSILNPDDDVVKNFPKGMMRAYKGVLKDEEIRKIVDYIKTLNESK